MRDLKYRDLKYQCTAESQEQHNERWGVHIAETPVRYSGLINKNIAYYAHDKHSNSLSMTFS